MKKKTYAIGMLTMATIALTSENAGAVKGTNQPLHNVVIVKEGGDSLAGALGIEGDRKRELELDIISSVKAAMGGQVDTLSAIIAIGAQHAQSDNELVYVTAEISKAFALHMAGVQPFTDLETQLEEENGLPVANAENTNQEEDSDGMPAGLAEALQQLLGATRDRTVNA